MPRCEAVRCRRPDGRPHAVMECSHHPEDLTPSSTCGFRCLPGYVLQGTETLTCTRNGEWDSDTP
ncbi:P-selectin precursor-like, partial [Arapaima gigas]